jgi:hypothetical protein
MTHGSSYDGKWCQNLRQGHGKKKLGYGSEYCGEWYANKRHGKG